MNFKIYERYSDEEMRNKIAAELLEDDRFRKLFKKIGGYYDVEVLAEYCSDMMVTDIRHNWCVGNLAWEHAPSDEQTRQLILHWLLFWWSDDGKSVEVDDGLWLARLVYNIF